MNATPAFQHSSAHPESSLSTQLKSRILNDGPITFCDYMATALYHPELGYYTSSSQRVGKEGDFITSVSIGPCFGKILANRLHTYWLESGASNNFHIIEPGGHDGALCADILTEIQRIDPKFYQATHYHLIETSHSLAQAQQDNLGSDFAGKFSSHLSLQEVHHLHGAILSNELIDAFPVELIRFENKKWHQLMVNLNPDDHSLTLAPRDISHAPELETFCKTLGNRFPDGYTTEYNPGILNFARDAAHALDSGLLITIDYGHDTVDYYHPDRTTGTLQTYHQHKKSDDPLIAPGEIDITAHIDFTRLTTAAQDHGFASPSLRTQASYLTDHARSWLLDIENPDTPTDPQTPNLIRQFQTLIHPAILGTKFSVLEMTK